MTTQDPIPNERTSKTETSHPEADFADGPADAATQPPAARVGTIVWGLVVIALAALIIISKLGIVTLNGTYVLIGLMLGAGAALVVGGLLSMRRKDGAGGTSTGPR